MQNPTVGQTVRIANPPPEDFDPGDIVTVTLVDASDSTVKVTRVADAKTSGWIDWKDICSIGVGWDYCKSVLPDEVIALLSACAGSETLTLRNDIRDAIISNIPDLRDRILDVMSRRSAP